MTDEKLRPVRVRFYTRPGCHLCDEARREMLAAGVSELYRLEEIDIDTDPDLARRFGWDIPVIQIGDAIAFKHRLTGDEFGREIRRAAFP
jgi:hypothetical protein